MKILITGSNGLLGSKLIALFDKEGVNYVATSRGECRVPNLKGKYRALDITDSNEVMKTVSEERPDVIIHAAAMTNVDQCELNQKDCWVQNVESVKNIVLAANHSNSFLVFLSTDFIFNGEKGPLTEEEEPSPVNYYGESKLAAEMFVIQNCNQYSIARTVLVYGIAPGLSRSNIILWVKSSLEEGKTIQVVDDQFRTPTLAEDLAQGCFLIAKKRAAGVFNISGSDFLTPYQMAIKTAEFFKLDKSLINRTDSSIFKQPAHRPLRTGFVIDKAVGELGYHPHSFDEGIEIIAAQIN